MKQCSKCHQPAVIFIQYNGTHLCQTHFFDYVERRVKKEITKQGKTQKNTTIGVALSGGKDSTVCLSLLCDIYKKRSHVHLVAITVDEGIQGYRPASIQVAQQTCEELHIDHHIISFKNVFDITMDEIASQDHQLGDCSFCGVFRRQCLNLLGKKLNVDKLATGHNLDDMAQSILMNFVNGDIEKLARLGPHEHVQPGLIPRMLPLRTIPEKELTLYAILKKFKFHHGQCPYAHEALRGEFRDIVDELEQHHPGTRHSIVKSYDGIKPSLMHCCPSVPLHSCVRCGEPTTQNMCKACLLQEQVIH